MPYPAQEILVLYPYFHPVHYIVCKIFCHKVSICVCMNCLFSEFFIQPHRVCTYRNLSFTTFCSSKLNCSFCHLSARYCTSFITSSGLGALLKIAWGWAFS